LPGSGSAFGGYSIKPVQVQAPEDEKNQPAPSDKNISDIQPTISVSEVVNVKVVDTNLQSRNSSNN
jgi:hypothetical protein